MKLNVRWQKVVLVLALLLFLGVSVAGATWGICAWCGVPFQTGDWVKYVGAGEYVHSECYQDYIEYWSNGDPPWQQDPIDVPWVGK